MTLGRAIGAEFREGEGKQIGAGSDGEGGGKFQGRV